MPISTICDWCGKAIKMPPSQFYRSKEHFCSRQCRMIKMNRELNPVRMTPETREKISKTRRMMRYGEREGKSYIKKNGRHLHRSVAEEILGRPLREGEVVHHINGNKRDNRKENLMVFPSQAEHARWHKLQEYGRKGGANEIHTT